MEGTAYFRIQIRTRTSAGLRYLAAIEAQGDPGYAATSVMLGEPHCASPWTGTSRPAAPTS